MDLITLEFILIILIAVIALIIIVYFLRETLTERNRKKKLQRRLLKIMKILKLQPYKKDYFSNKFLALDSTNKVVLYLDHLKSETATLIHLKHLKECKLLVRGLIVRLDLIFHDVNDVRFSIIFYRRFVDPDNSRNFLTDKARKWQELFLQSTKR